MCLADRTAPQSWLVLLQELLGVGAIVIEIDSNDGEALALVRVLHRLHPGK